MEVYFTVENFSIASEETTSENKQRKWTEREEISEMGMGRNGLI